MEKYIDADKLRKLLANRYEEITVPVLTDEGGLESFYRRSEIHNILKIVDSLQQEQPDVDLEKEIEKEWEKLEKDYSPSALDKSHIIVSGLVGEKQFSRIAHHFYELCKIVNEHGQDRKNTQGD